MEEDSQTETQAVLLPHNSSNAQLPNSGTPTSFFVEISGGELPPPMATDDNLAGRRQNVMRTPCVKVMKIYLLAALAVVCLVYQGKALSMNDTDPVPLWTLLVSSLLYWLIDWFKDNYPSPILILILNGAAIALVILSVSSIWVVLLPPTATLRHKYWIVVNLVLGFFLIYCLYICLHAKFVTAPDQILARPELNNLPPPAEGVEEETDEDP